MINKDYINNYIRSVTPNNREEIQVIENYAKENFVPIVQPEVAQLLKVLIKIKKPKRILEIGTAIGYSSIIMAEAYKESKITTIEIREDMVDIALENIGKIGLKDRIDIILGDGNDIMANLNEKYDFIFLDAAKGQYINFLEKAKGLLNVEGVIVSDNVLFKGMVASDELVERRKKTIVKRLRNYLEEINNLDGYISSLIPIGDGVSITYREGKNFEG